MGKRSRGWTRPVLLAVAFLACALLLWLALMRPASTGPDIDPTSARLLALTGALVRLSDPQGYALRPPTDPAHLRGPGNNPVGAELGSPNDTNLGIESVFVACFLEGVNLGEALDEITDDMFGNTDGDRMVAGNPTRVPNGHLMEFVDGWGNPFAYFRGADMKDWKKYSKYVMADGRVVEAKPWTRPDASDYIHTGSFQLFSAGRDQQFNTEDDIKSWQ